MHLLCYKASRDNTEEDNESPLNLPSAKIFSTILRERKLCREYSSRYEAPWIRTNTMDRRSVRRTFYDEMEVRRWTRLLHSKTTVLVIFARALKSRRNFVPGAIRTEILLDSIVLRFVPFRRHKPRLKRRTRYREELKEVSRNGPWYSLFYSLTLSCSLFPSFFSLSLFSFPLSLSLFSSYNCQPCQRRHRASKDRYSINVERLKNNTLLHYKSARSSPLPSHDFPSVSMIKSYSNISHSIPFSERYTYRFGRELFVNS